MRILSINNNNYSQPTFKASWKNLSSTQKVLSDALGSKRAEDLLDSFARKADEFEALKLGRKKIFVSVEPLEPKNVLVKLFDRKNKQVKQTEVIFDETSISSDKDASVLLRAIKDAALGRVNVDEMLVRLHDKIMTMANDHTF